MHRSIITGEKVLTRDGWREDHGVMVAGTRIEDVLPADQCSSDRRDFPGAWIVPGFIDVQVNGGGGVLFNESITVEAIRSIGEAHARFGTTGFLPTLISDTPEAMARALDAAALAMDQGAPGALGLHLEGPFLNERKRGIHNAAHFRNLDEETVQRLLAWGHGSLLVTIAPEIIGTPTIERLTKAGVLVSAGHTQASYEATKDALRCGLRGFTHLYNAMPPLVSREPGPVAAALESDAWCGMIADGHHVAPSMLNLAIRAKRDGRIMLVSDAMAIAESTLTSFELGGVKIILENGRCVDEHGTLAGSSITMLDAVRYCVQELKIPLDEALRMATAEPAAFLGRSNELGALAPGYRANFVVITQQFEVIASFIDGTQVYQKA